MENTEYKGLTDTEVLEIRAKYGFNEIPEKTESFFVRLLKKLLSPIPLMIEVALVLSAIIQHWEDFYIIALLLIVNLSVDLFQEQKANTALQALKQTLAPTALVLRDGKLMEIAARELVPDDIVKMNIGEVVPADLVILDDEEVEVDQSAITGESLPVILNKGDKLLSGSVVQKGSVYCRVLAIGAETVMGKNIELVSQAELEEESHFQKAIVKIGKFLIVTASVLVFATSLIMFLRGQDTPLEIIRFALVLAIASIPVALPAVLSVTMAIGAHLLAKRNTIVANFRAIEELAGVSHLCVDKTGTLTKNEIAVTSPILYKGHSEQELFVFAYLALEDGQRSSIERAVHKYVLEKKYDQIAKQYEIKDFIPFDPVKKTTEAIFVHNGEEVRVLMGAPQVVAAKVSSKVDKEQLQDDVEKLAADGFRSLAVSFESKDGCIPVGLIPLMDPPRDDSKAVISDLKKRGITIKMLTGDNVKIARYIAKLLGIGEKVSDRTLLDKVKETEGLEDDKKAIDDTDVFAEVIPEDKFNIVKTLQSDSRIVAMTGDGVNDAPALKKADIGIAVSGATPAARSASDLVLLDNGLSIIRDAVDQARQTFARMEAYATFRIAETIRIVFFISLAVLVFNFTPLTAVMIIILALLNDIPVLAIAYDNVPTSEEPVRWRLKETLIVAFVLGMAGLVSSFILLYYLDVTGWEIALMQSIFFLKMDVAGHSTLYLIRTGRKHFWEKPYPSLKFFIPAFSSRLIGTLIVYFGVMVPALSIEVIAAVWIYATVWFLINDQIKVLTYKILDKYKNKQTV